MKKPLYTTIFLFFLLGGTAMAAPYGGNCFTDPYQGHETEGIELGYEWSGVNVGDTNNVRALAAFEQPAALQEPQEEKSEDGSLL